MTRLETTFARLSTEGRGGLVTYTTAGDPDLPRSGAILTALDRAGADVLEVGIPFSDPLADGPVIQRAAERALAAGGTLRSALAMIRDVRATVRAPIVLFTYANPLMRFGVETFAHEAAAVGVDGVLVLDLPIEEAGAVRNALAEKSIHLIFLLSPTTSDRRIAKAAELGSGFLYCISRMGVTGARDSVADGAEALVRRIRAHTTLPIALGFGLSRPEHVAEVTAYAEAAVVGSALVALVAEQAESPQLMERLTEYVQWLKGAGRRDDQARRSS